MRATVIAVFLAATAATPVQALSAGRQAHDWRPNCFSLPVRQPFVISRMFGDPNTPFSGIHDGLDLKMPPGRPILAMAGGLVTKAGLDRDGAAVIVVLTPAGRLYILGHLSRVYVHRGQVIRRGQYIGKTGGAVHAPGSGPNTTGPHLHIGILGKDSKPIDPVKVVCDLSDPPSPSR